MAKRYTYTSDRAAQDLHVARLMVGRRLIALTHDQYYFNEEKCLGDIGDIEWHIDDHPTIAMYLLSDGDSAGADLLPIKTPTSFDLKPDATCSWKRENLLAALSVSHLEGDTVCEVEGILDSLYGQDPRLVGFRITFASGHFLVFLNQGDDAVMLVNALPPACPEIETCFVTSIE
jgi:hypothetical protein